MGYPVAESHQIIEHRAEIGDENRRSRSIVYGAVDREAQPEFLVAQDSFVATDYVRHEAEAPLQSGRCLRDHGRIEPDSDANGEYSSVAQSAKIERRFIAVEEQRYRAGRV